MRVAESMALRATCKRAQHGCVITKDNQIVATGYNGSLPGEPHCVDVGCLMIDGHCKRTLHAEENAIIQAARMGVSLAGGWLYVTGEPCLDDAKRIIRAGITVVMIRGSHPYPDPHEEYKGDLYRHAKVSVYTMER